MPLVMARRGAAALLKDCGAKDGRRLEGVKFPSDTVKINLIFCSPPQWQRGAGKGHLLSQEKRSWGRPSPSSLSHVEVFHEPNAPFSSHSMAVECEFIPMS